jgi:DNA-nicking Smr family endonuclease
MAKLSDLRTLLDQARARAHAHPSKASAPRVVGNPKRSLAATKHADGDIDIHHAFADVTRLPAIKKASVAPPRPAPLPQQTLQDERNALHAAKYGHEPAPHTWDIGQEIEGEQTFLRPGLGTDVLAGLRRGRWVVQAELDLHRMTTHEAHEAIALFLGEARVGGLRCVRIIHGKGLTSPNREPVLKGKVRRWLARVDDVLAYCEAPRHAGGSGAVVLLLRGK